MPVLVNDVLPYGLPNNYFVQSYMLSWQGYIFIANKEAFFSYHVKLPPLRVNGHCQAGVIMSANHKKILQRETSSHEIRSLIP